MIEKVSQTLTRIVQDDASIIALMRSQGVYEEILEHQITGQTVLMVSDDYLFIWSDDEYMCYHSVNRGELEVIAFMFKSSAHGI